MTERLTREAIFHDLQPGMAVMTSDASRLGKVKTISNDRFRIDVRLGRDYWLPRASLLFVDLDAGTAVVDFHRGEERNFRVAPPTVA